MEHTTSTDIVPAGFEIPRGEPGPFAPCMLLVDCSASMQADGAIDEVNRAMKQFAVEVNDDELARNRADIAVVALQEPGLRVESPPALARDFRPPSFNADGATPMGGAIRLGLETIELRREEYRSRGAKAFAAMMFLITDGEPTDDFIGPAQEAHAMEARGKLNFFCIGTGSANFSTLSRISPPGRDPARLAAGSFRELFRWISDSLTITANSIPGEQPPLPPAQGWMSVQT
jgi:uncharacterized protein YegL